MAEASKTASIGTAILSLGTILGCLAVPGLAERLGRKKTLAIYFVGMFVCISLSFGWAFYLENGLKPFIACLFFLGFFGGNFALFSLWLPEQYETSVRATAFSFATSFGRFIGAGVNFLIGAMVRHAGTMGKPVAYAVFAFGLGLLIIPFREGNTRTDVAELRHLLGFPLESHHSSVKSFFESGAPLFKWREHRCFQTNPGPPAATTSGADSYT